MICTIKPFGQLMYTHTDCRAIKDVPFCQLSNGKNRIPTPQMLLEAVLVIRCLE